MLGLQMKIIEHTKTIFGTRYKEYIQAMTNTNIYSECSNHVFNTGHIYSTITNTMDVVRTGDRGGGEHAKEFREIPYLFREPG
jgi:hypothetical protein